MNQNIFNDIQNDTLLTAYCRRHVYTAEPVTVDGVTDKVIFVIPFTDGDCRPETVEDKLKYLIDGKKS